MPRFSLRQILIAVVALGIGFSIWRLPQGNWIDIPLATLSFYFVLSLWRHAAATRRLLIEHPALPRQQRWGGRFFVVELLGTAMALIVAWIFGYLAVAELLLTKPADRFLEYVEYPTLPRDFAVLAMLVATGLGSWQSSPAKATPPRQRVYDAVAASGMLIGIILYWADRMLVWFLVYLAVSGVEMAEPPRFLPPEMNVSTAVRIHRFTLFSFAGLPLVIANLLLIGGLLKFWNKPHCRSMLMILLAAGLAANVWLARWIAVQGIRQLSPSFQEAIQVPPLAGITVIASMILLTVGAFSWRCLAKPAPVDHSPHVSDRTLYFHENWLGGLLLGVVAVISVVNTLISSITTSLNSPYSSNTIDWETFVYGLTNYPTQFIWLAAAIGGFAMAWFRWRGRKEPVGANLPCVNPAQFAVTLASLLIVVVAGAPVLAAVSFSYWFVQLGSVF